MKNRITKLTAVLMVVLIMCAAFAGCGKASLNGKFAAYLGLTSENMSLTADALQDIEESVTDKGITFTVKQALTYENAIALYCEAEFTEEVLGAYSVKHTGMTPDLFVNGESVSQADKNGIHIFNLTEYATKNTAAFVIRFENGSTVGVKDRSLTLKIDRFTLKTKDETVAKDVRFENPMEFTWKVKNVGLSKKAIIDGAVKGEATLCPLNLTVKFNSDVDESKIVALYNTEDKSAGLSSMRTGFGSSRRYSFYTYVDLNTISSVGISGEKFELK